MDDLTRLFIAARDGDRTALLEAIRASQAEVWRLASHLVGPDEADDVTQDTYLRAWRALPAYRADASARTWLLSIARRACADAIRSRVRRRRRDQRQQAEAWAHRASWSSEGSTGSVSLQALVDGLDPDHRSAFVLTQIIGCSYDETAAICSVPIGTIRSRVARARDRLVAAVRAAEAS